MHARRVSIELAETMIIAKPSTVSLGRCEFDGLCRTQACGVPIAVADPIIHQFCKSVQFRTTKAMARWT